MSINILNGELMIRRDVIHNSIHVTKKISNHITQTVLITLYDINTWANRQHITQTYNFEVPTSFPSLIWQNAGFDLIWTMNWIFTNALTTQLFWDIWFSYHLSCEIVWITCLQSIISGVAFLFFFLDTFI